MKIHILNPIFSILFILFFNIGCSEKGSKKVQSQDSTHRMITEKKIKWVRPNRQLGKDSIWSDDWKFIADSVLHGYNQSLEFYFKKYDNDTCAAMVNAKTNYLPNFDGVLPIGVIKKNKSKDSVFVLQRLRWCDNDGDAYYFTDTSLPRLETDSYCCRPNNLFSIGDIDEDGIAEIAVWHSSCASKFKALIVYSLKSNQWKQVGSCLIFADEFEKMKQRVKKIKKGEFEMYEVSDDYPEPRKGEWIHFKI